MLELINMENAYMLTLTFQKPRQLCLFVTQCMLKCNDSFNSCSSVFITRWQVCPSCSAGGLGARHNGLCEVWSLWADLQTWQLCLWWELKCQQCFVILMKRLKPHSDYSSGLGFHLYTFANILCSNMQKWSSHIYIRYGRFQPHSSNRLLICM